jgi:uncharacterized protein
VKITQTTQTIQITRFGRVLATLAFLAGLVSCASSPPPQLYRLRAAAPVEAPATKASAEVWQLALPVPVPDYLDRDALVVPQGQAGLQALPGHRWAEPLRESVPRLLRQDLATLLGEQQVWTSPVPAGVRITRLLRVELLALEAAADRSTVTLRARWTLVDPTGTRTPNVENALLTVPVAGPDVDSLVAAHRLALWRLAQRIAQGG